MDENLENDGRWYPQSPVVAVSAVVFKEDRILMIKRGNEPDKGKWSIPGGRLELGETINDGVRREVLEECSIEIEIERLLDAGQNIIRDEEGRIQYHAVLLDLLARYVSGETKAQSDAEECRWVTPAELAQLDIILSLRSMLERAGIL